MTLRSSGSVALKKIVNGVFSNIASAPLDVSINRTYRVRLESVGKRQRVYVNGVPMLDADDAAIPSGRAGLLTYRAAANFDNGVVSPTPATSLFVGNQYGIQATTDVWTRTASGQWVTTVSDLPNTLRYVQTSVAGDARATVGVVTDDQSVDVRARATTFAGGSGGDRWFGAIARYSNATNYYYFSLRSSNMLSLRKVTDGQITVLRSVALPVVLGRWYRLRLEAVGSQLRAYVNGTLWLEASDTTHAFGQTGIVTFRTAAGIRRPRAIQPRLRRATSPRIAEAGRLSKCRRTLVRRRSVVRLARPGTVERGDIHGTHEVTLASAFLSAEMLRSVGITIPQRTGGEVEQPR